MTGMGNLFDMMKNAKEMMDKAKSVQAQLAKRVVDGSAGADLVIATVNGNGELVGLKMDPSVINPDDQEVLTDLIIAAVADARRKTASLKAEAMRELTGGVDLSSLGLDLSGLM